MIVSGWEIMQIENSPLSPSGCGQADDLREDVSVGSWLGQRWVKEEGLATHLLQISQLPTDAWGSIAGWELSPHSLTNRTHSYPLTKSKRHFGQQQSARIRCPGSVPSLSGPTSSPESSSHPCLCKSTWITTLEIQPRAHLLIGLVPDLHHITQIINFFSILPPSCMESLYWST